MVPGSSSREVRLEELLESFPIISQAEIEKFVESLQGTIETKPCPNCEGRLSSRRDFRFGQCHDCRIAEAAKNRKQHYSLRDLKAARREFDRFVKLSLDGCWEWEGSKDANGYGLFKIKGRTVRAHRISLELRMRELLREQWALHHCDNPGCCRPDHLYAGNVYDNVRDAVERGRYRAKLTEESVREIRLAQLKDPSISPKSLAEKYNVSTGSIIRILKRDTWKHVNP